MGSEGEPQYAVAVAFANRGRWRTARSRCLAALADSPDDPFARSLLWRVDAELGHVSFAEAEHAVRSLSSEHPDLKGLKMRAISLLARRGNRVEALREARMILAQDQDDPAAHELVASLSCCSDDISESLLHYKMALDLGGLARPASRLAVLVQARRMSEPATTSRQILADASALERLALRTASSLMVSRGVVAAIVIGLILAVIGNVELGIASTAVASLLAGWRTFCCLYICWDKSEVRRLVGFVAPAWGGFGLVLWMGTQVSKPFLFAVVAVAVALGVLIGERGRQRSSNRTADSVASE